MKTVQELTVRKTLTTSTSRIAWQPLVGLVAAIVVMSIVVVNGEELKHVPPAAPTFMVLHSFAGSPTDGAIPGAGLIQDTAGNLYGSTVYGGAESSACWSELECGVVFRLSPTGAETVLYRFSGGADGGNPGSLIRDAAGNLYGTAYAGGAKSSTCQFGTCGVVFKLSLSGTETVLYSFTGGADGGNPGGDALVRDAAGNLYGTASGGGASNACFGGPCGVVFKLSPAGTETVLHTFTGGADGGVPFAGLTRDAAGNLYGTTGHGGASGNGVVFELIRCDSAPSGYDFKVLYTFTGGADGGPFPSGLIQDTAGNLYGTTEEGGSRACSPGCGTVFKVGPTGSQTVLYRFTGGADGAFPGGGLTRDTAGNLYGTTLAGGVESSACQGGQPTCGVVFRLSPTGTEKVLHSFTGFDGAQPSTSLIQDAGGNLYGTTGFGGTNTCYPPYGCGVVFRLTP
jgi:uncharacterized repeat protein (TIGR03803 family)